MFYTFVVFRRRFPWNLVLLGVFVSGVQMCYVENIRKMFKTCFISQTLALSYMCGTISRFVLGVSTNTPGRFTIVAHLICDHLCFLLQLLRHQSRVPRHGNNGFSLPCCHRLLLPNQGEGMKRLLCL